MTKCEDQQKNCEEKFVAWKWMVGIVGGIIIVVSGLAYSYARQETFQDTKISGHESRIANVERIHNDLDTLKFLLRILQK